MKALFCGLGSIGTKRLKSLAACCAEKGLPLEARALRATARPLPAEVKALLAGEMAALPEGESYDVAFITGPTHTHADTIKALRGRVGAFFIEKPIFEAAHYDLEALGLGADQKAYVAAPLRHTRLYQKLQGLAAQTPFYSARAICSSYLPEWRPGTDYRTVYSAKRAMGGGVALDLVHEWDYLVGLFGLPLHSCAVLGKFSHLEIDSDDLAVYVARYPGLACEIHLDYFGRAYRRTLELMGEAGTWTADFGAATLTAPNGAVEHLAEDADLGHRREMAYFLAYALGPEPESINSPARALAVLRLALGEK